MCVCVCVCECVCVYVYVCACVYVHMHIVFVLTFTFDFLIFICCLNNFYDLEFNNCVVNFDKNENKKLYKKSNKTSYSWYII